MHHVPLMFLSCRRTPAKEAYMIPSKSCCYCTKDYGGKAAPNPLFYLRKNKKGGHQPLAINKIYRYTALRSSGEHLVRGRGHAMRYTVQQFQNALELRPEAYRGWIKSFGFLQVRQRRGGSFSLNQMFAVFVLLHLHHTSGISRAKLVPFGPDWFELCRSNGWLQLAQGQVAFDLGQKTVTRLPREGGTVSGDSVIVVSLQPLAEKLGRILLMEAEDDPQYALRLPPVPVSWQRAPPGGGGRPDTTPVRAAS